MLIEFKNKKLNIRKLLSFGFAEQNGCYVYCADLMDKQMKMTISISQDGKISTEVLDNSSKEEYVLHLVDGAVGPFVGQIRAEYQNMLEDISLKCFDLDVFKNEQTKSVIAYVKQKYGDDLEFLWQKFPDNAIVRRKDNKKWYAALLTVSRRKLGLDSDEMTEIIDIRMTPQDIQALVDNKKYFPGYHMNKKHWVTVCLDNTVPLPEIYGKIDESYILALK